MARRRRALFLTLGLIPLAVACSRDEPPHAVVRDSAGVQIVESSGPQWTPDTHWRRSERPLLIIGALEGPPETQFTRIIAAAWTEGGDIVAANFNNPPEIRVFGGDGKHRATMGGEGQGPGEFSGIAAMGLVPPDTIHVYDFWLQRFSAFGPDGNVLFVTPLLNVAGKRPQSYAILGRFRDGSWLARDNTYVPPDARGRGRADATLFRMDMHGAVLDTLAVVPDVEYYVNPGQEGGSVIMGVWAAMLAHGDRLYAGAGDAFRVDEYDLDGRLVRSFRRAYERRRVTQADVDLLKERELTEARSQAQRAFIERRYAEAPVADFMPAHGRRMFVDLPGNVWVQEYPAPGDTAQSWSIFDVDRTYLGSLAFPPGYVPVDATGDTVLGVMTDELDVPSLVVFGPVKPERPSSDD